MRCAQDDAARAAEAHAAAGGCERGRRAQRALRRTGNVHTGHRGRRCRPAGARQRYAVHACAGIQRNQRNAAALAGEGRDLGEQRRREHQAQRLAAARRARCMLRKRQRRWVLRRTCKSISWVVEHRRWTSCKASEERGTHRASKHKMQSCQCLCFNPVLRSVEGPTAAVMLHRNVRIPSAPPTWAPPAALAARMSKRRSPSPAGSLTVHEAPVGAHTAVSKYRSCTDMLS